MVDMRARGGRRVLFLVDILLLLLLLFSAFGF
jgi:hypothetical protein